MKQLCLVKLCAVIEISFSKILCIQPEMGNSLLERILRLFASSH